MYLLFLAMPRKFRYTRPKNVHKKLLSVVTPPHSELETLHSLLPELPPRWIDQTTNSQRRIRLCKVQSCEVSGAEKRMPECVTHCITVAVDLSWTVHVHGHQLTPSPNSPLSSVPEKVSASTLAHLIHLLDRAHLCPGHPDTNFLNMANSRKGKFTSIHGGVTAYVGGSFNGSEYPQTVRTTGCTILVHGGKCDSCKSFRSSLRAMYSRWCTVIACSRLLCFAAASRQFIKEEAVIPYRTHYRQHSPH